MEIVGRVARFAHPRKNISSFSFVFYTGRGRLILSVVYNNELWLSGTCTRVGQTKSASLTYLNFLSILVFYVPIIKKERKKERKRDEIITCSPRRRNFHMFCLINQILIMRFC
jgi:hypothetical protein